MPYARFDDRWDDHRKIKRALRREPAAVAMHAMAITYANRHNSNGLIDLDWIEEKLALMPLKERQRRVVLDVLLELNLFERVDDETFQVHDFLDWNLSREQRQALAEQGRKGGRSRKGSSGPEGNGSGPGSSDRRSEGSSPGFSHSGNGGSSTPTPRHATPTPSHEASAKADAVAAAPPLDAEDLVLGETVAHLCHLMSSEVRTAHGIAEKSREALPVKGWKDSCRAMLTLDGYTSEQIEFAIRWVCRHHYWRRRVKSMTRLRSEMEQVVKEIREQRERGAAVVPIRGRRENASDLLRALDGGAA